MTKIFNLNSAFTNSVYFAVVIGILFMVAITFTVAISSKEKKAKIIAKIISFLIMCFFIFSIINSHNAKNELKSQINSYSEQHPVITLVNNQYLVDDNLQNIKNPIEPIGKFSAPINSNNKRIYFKSVPQGTKLDIPIQNKAQYNTKECLYKVFL